MYESVASSQPRMRKQEDGIFIKYSLYYQCMALVFRTEQHVAGTRHSVVVGRSLNMIWQRHGSRLIAISLFCRPSNHELLSLLL